MNEPVPGADATLPELRFGPIWPAHTQRYARASLDDNPVHTDLQAARSIGLDGPVVQGMLLMGLFPRVIANWQADFRIRRLYTAFLRPMPVGTSLVLGGRVAKVEQGGGVPLLHLRLLARTEEGELVCVAEASGSKAASQAAANT